MVEKGRKEKWGGQGGKRRRLSERQRVRHREWGRRERKRVLVTGFWWWVFPRLWGFWENFYH